MGRKKKTNEIEIKPKTESIISYSGGATIKIMKNGKVRRTIQQHNEGSNYLFSFLTQCLAGNFYKVNRPQLVRVGNYSSETFTEYSLSYVRVSTSRAYTKDGNEVVDFSFNFPGTLINIPTDADSTTGLNCLRIYSDTNATDISKYSAQIILTGDDIITSLTKEESLLIIWEMQIESINTQGGNE